MTDKTLSGAFAVPVVNPKPLEKTTQPLFYATAAFPDGAARALKLLGADLPALPNRLCWLTAEKVSSRQWVITRHHCQMTSQEIAPQAEPYMFEGERISNGEVIRALSGWIRSQKHTPLEGLSEGLNPEAKKVTSTASKSYSHKPQGHRHS